MSGEQFNPQDSCGCCEGVSIEAPIALENRPGLSAIAYRIGTHGEILASLQARLSSQNHSELEKLRTRDSDDFTLALLDAYASMADVLTFYQERIANESYMRTAGERLSLSEMARLIGYHLKPGVAAETFLAFTMQEPPPQAPGNEPKQASGVPETITLDAGIKVQSIPGPDEKPQTFETVESVEMRPEWNVLLPRMHEMKVPVFGTQVVYLKGTAMQLKAGDALLFVGSERENDTGNENWDFRRVQSVVLDSAADRTAVTLNYGLGTALPYVAPAADPEVYVLRQRASLFGYNAPDWRVMSDSVRRGYMGIGAGDPIVATEWPGFSIAELSDPPTSVATGTGLYGEYFDNENLTNRKFSHTDSTVDFPWELGSPDSIIGAETFSVRWTGWVHAPVSGNYSFHTLSDDGARLWVDNKLIINDWKEHGSQENTGIITLTAGKKYDIRLEYYENTGAAIIRLFWTPPGQAKQIIPQERLYPRNIYTLHLDALYPQIVHDSWLVLSIPEYQELYQVNKAGEDARAAFTLTSKTTRLTLKGENLHELFNERLRETAVFANSEKLTLAETPITENVTGDFLHVDCKVEELAPGRKLILSGTTTSGDEASEVLTLLKIEYDKPDDNTSKIFFTTPLNNQYKRDSVKLYANVARATHGETVRQTLGSGAASQVHQRFSLGHAPLTYVGAQNESGAEAALEVRVNDILWHEAPTLFNAGANERKYVLRTGEDGGGIIQFGDGRRAARLPTGPENVRATYRKGIGAAGNLKPGQLSQLLSRPLGLKAVSNPLKASGGVDADSADNARRNMPLGVRALGRVVSIKDYEDFARAYTGIAKAQATVLNINTKRTVFISVAGDNGVKPPSLMREKLLKALKQNGDPLVHCELDAYNPAPFSLALHIKCDPDYESKKVRADVEAALRAAFSFDARDFGQIVSRSEVIAVAQEVAGVLGVKLDSFTPVPPTPEGNLSPAAAKVDAGIGVAAGILLLDKNSIVDVKEMT